MQLDSFVEKFSSLFEDTDPTQITSKTNFRELEEWDSMLALSIIAMSDEEYGVQLKGDDIRNSVTVEDLYNKINSKIQA